MEFVRKWWFAPILLLAAALFLWLYWLRPRPEQVIANPECPDHDKIEVHEGDGTAQLSEVKLAGSLTFIPEFHDCQKLIVPVTGNPAKFGPLVAIWVSENLERLPDSLRELNPTNAWHRPNADSNWVVVDSTNLGASPQPADPTKLIALPFAVIHAWNEGYPLLQIPKGWSCLYLYPSLSGVGYGARLVQVAVDSACFEPRSLTRLDGVSLDVSVGVVTGLTKSDYPAVGRWDTDPRSNDVYIGMKCGAAWCEVSSARPHVTSERYSTAEANLGPTMDPTNRIQARILAVKGWYDEQRIAVRSATGGLEPAAFRAIVVPDAGLDDLTFGSEGTWHRVGWAALETGSTEYEDKLNVAVGSLPPGGSPSGGTDYWLCKGSECTFPQNVTKPSCTFDPSEGPWYSRAVAVATGKEKYDCVVRHDHPTVAKVWGTARWRWEDNDEKLWFRCNAGCCSGQ